MQSLILSVSQKQPAQFLPFSLLSLAIFAYQYTSALYYQATSVTEAASYLRWQVTFVCIIVPLLTYQGRWQQYPGRVVTPAEPVVYKEP